MRTLFITTRNPEAFSGEIVQVLEPAAVIVTYCCRESQKVRDLPKGFIIKVQAKSRSELERNPLVIRVRAKEPERGWASLNRNQYVMNC